MTRRLALLLLATGVLAIVFALDRFVFNTSGDDTIALPVSRTDRQKPKLPPREQGKAIAFLVPLTDFAEIWNRPVFTPSRKPAAVSAGPRTQNRTAPSGDAPPDFNIVGVALGPTNSAVLVREDRRTIKRYYMGDLIRGWTIEEIKADSVTITRDDERWLLPVGASH